MSSETTIPPPVHPGDGREARSLASKAGDVAIHVQNLSKCYQIYNKPQDRLKQSLVPRLQRLIGKPQSQYARQFWALRNVSFEIGKGETVGIVGRNGSGKSTLLQLICGTVAPTSGGIDVDGRIAALLELGSGFNPEFTGRENVYMNASVLGLTRDQIDARCDDIVAFADIEDFIEQPTKTYSSGMYVRLAFAVAVNVDPDVLIIDEALAVGDEAFQRKCFGRIEHFRDAGKTILLVSHSGQAVIQFCDRALLVDGGELIAQGRPKSIVNAYYRLIYAPPERSRAIREQVRSGDLLAGREPEESLPTLSQSEQEAPSSTAFFDDSLPKPASVAYEPRGARIEDCWLETLGGRRVNIVHRGDECVYRYRVRFEQRIEVVRFGMLIKTLSGLELGGSVSAVEPEDYLPAVERGEIIEASFRLNCALNPGTYIANAGVLGRIGDEEVYLHRILDAFMFRVFPERNLRATGVVDFAIQPTVRKLA